MKPFAIALTLTLTLTLPLLLAAAPASAQSAPSAEFELSIGTNLERSENFKRAESSFAIDLRDRFGLQADISVSKYQTADSITPAGALHLVWAASDALTLGAFFQGETPLGDTLTGLGLEAAWDDGPWRIEGFWATTDAVNGDQTGQRGGIDVTHRLDNGGLILGGYHMDEFAGIERDYGYLGGGWQVNDTLTAEARYARTDAGDGVITLGVTLRTDPVPFNRRDAFASLPGY